MPGQPVERAGNLQGNAGPYQNVLDARQHGAVKRRQMRDLELFQEVDAYGIAVALARQNYLHEVGGNAQLLELARAVMSVQRQELVCSALCLPARNVIRLKTRAAMAGKGNCWSARRMCPPWSPSCRRRANTWSSAVPETTPSWPCRETALASRQPETATPIPPWMMMGKLLIPALWQRSEHPLVRVW